MVAPVAWSPAPGLGGGRRSGPGLVTAVAPLPRLRPPLWRARKRARGGSREPRAGLYCVWSSRLWHTRRAGNWEGLCGGPAAVARARAHAARLALAGAASDGDDDDGDDGDDGSGVAAGRAPRQAAAPAPAAQPIPRLRQLGLRSFLNGPSLELLLALAAGPEVRAAAHLGAARARRAASFVLWSLLRVHLLRRRAWGEGRGRLTGALTWRRAFAMRGFGRPQVRQLQVISAEDLVTCLARQKHLVHVEVRTSARRLLSLPAVAPPRRGAAAQLLQSMPGAPRSKPAACVAAVACARPLAGSGKEADGSVCAPLRPVSPPLPLPQVRGCTIRDGSVLALAKCPHLQHVTLAGHMHLEHDVGPRLQVRSACVRACVVALRCLPLLAPAARGCRCALPLRCH